MSRLSSHQTEQMALAFMALVHWMGPEKRSAISEAIRARYDEYPPMYQGLMRCLDDFDRWSNEATVP